MVEVTVTVTVGFTSVTIPEITQLSKSISSPTGSDDAVQEENSLISGLIVPCHEYKNHSDPKHK